MVFHGSALQGADGSVWVCVCVCLVADTAAGGHGMRDREGGRDGRRGKASREIYWKFW